MDMACEALKVGSHAELPGKAAAVAAELKAKDKEIEEINGKLASMQTQALANTAVEVGSVKLVYASLNGIKPDILRKITDRFRDTDPSIVAVFSTTLDGKASIAASCGKSAVEDGVHAGQLVKEICSLVGGSGGGRPDSATAGGKNPAKLEEALEAVNNIVDAML